MVESPVPNLDDFFVLLLSELHTDKRKCNTSIHGAENSQVSLGQVHEQILGLFKKTGVEKKTQDRPVQRLKTRKRKRQDL